MAWVKWSVAVSSSLPKALDVLVRRATGPSSVSPSRYPRRSAVPAATKRPSTVRTMAPTPPRRLIIVKRSFTPNGPNLQRIYAAESTRFRTRARRQPSGRLASLVKDESQRSGVLDRGV